MKRKPRRVPPRPAQLRDRKVPEPKVILPEDVINLLLGVTEYLEDLNGGTPQEWGWAAREDAEIASALLKKYGIKHQVSLELSDSEALGYKARVVYSDGTKGPWE